MTATWGENRLKQPISCSQIRAKLAMMAYEIYAFSLFVGGRVMKKLLIAGAALAGLIGTPSLAADMALKAPPPPPVPVCTWCGFYVGLNVGASGQWVNNTNPIWQQVGSPLGFTAPFNSGSNIIGGGQAGYNWQLGAWVLGVEASIDARHKTATSTITLSAIDQVNITQTEDWFGTARGRIGYAIGGNMLLYGTGGFAFGEVGHSYQENRITVPGQNRMISDSVTKGGWTVGAGVEYAVTKNVSIGVEYLYVDLGSDTLSLPTATVGGLAFPASQTGPFKDRSNEITAKLNWRFDSIGAKW
jgi:outer membrane immunogenic protein